MAAHLSPLLVLALYARSFWGSPAFGELADQGYHLELGRAFADAWQAGEFPPRWSATANGGLGSPAFELYPPLFAALTGCWMHLLGQGPEALRMSAFTAAVFNLCAGYWAARAWLSRSRAVAAAALALALPGVTFVALGRGMFPSFLALGWAALAAGAAKRSSAAVLAPAGAGLILTHTPTAYLALLTAITLQAASRAWPSRQMLGAGALALGVTAWFWAPMLETARFAQAGYLTEAHPYAESLWLAATPGGSEFDRDWGFLNQTAAYVGVAQCVLAAALYAATRRRELLVVAAWAAIASLWPTGLWLTALPYYERIQFCWRWQPLLAMSCALAFSSLPVRTALRLSPLLAVVAGFFLPLAAPSHRPSGHGPDLASNLIEMRPRGAAHTRHEPGPIGEIETLSGDCQVIPVEVQPSRRTYHVTAPAPCALRVRTYHFPGWRAHLDGTEIPVRADSRTALQLVEVPAGLHTLELSYKR